MTANIYATTFNQAGQMIPRGLHVPQNLAWHNYVPHPLQLTGHMNMFPVLGQSRVAVAGIGPSQRELQGANSGTPGRPL